MAHQKSRARPMPPDILHHARQLRQRMTDAETMLWSLLRRSQLGGHKFRRQHPIGRYIVDFYCAKARLAIELDGGQHTTPSQSSYDENRSKELAQRGIQILRFWNHDVLQHPQTVIEEIWQAINKGTEPE